MTVHDRIVVMHLCEHFGGAEASLHGVSRAFQWWIPTFDSARFKILLCSRKGPDKASEQMTKSGISPMHLGYAKMDPRNLFKLMHIVKHARVDILHAHGFGACLWARLVGHILKKPVIIHGRCNYGTVPLVMRPVERLLGPRTRHAFAVSESTRTFTIEQRHVPESVVNVLYNGILMDDIPRVTPEWVNAFRKREGVGPQEKIIGIVGRVVSHKGHLDLLAAVDILKQDHPDLHVWILGDGDFMPQLRTWLKLHTMCDRVRLFGFRRDVLSLIQCFDVQVFPSHYEGTPNTLFEALAVGNCIVAAPTDGQGEILEDEVTALMFDTGNIQALASRLNRLLRDTDLASTLRANALARSADFDGRRCVETMQNTYERIMANPCPPRKHGN